MPKRKLSVTDRTKMRAMYQAGARLKDIAAAFGVSPPAVLYWLREMGVHD